MTSYLDDLLTENPRRKQDILGFLERFLLIEDVFVDKNIFDYSFRCRTPGCGVCCFSGTAVKEEEIKRVGEVIEDIKPYLNPSNRKRLDKLGNIFYRKNIREGCWRIRTWNSSCIFLMDNKLCAVHKYCLDNDVNWIRFHFDLCVTYPFRISREEDFIHIEEELAQKEYTLPCFKTLSEDPSNPVIYTMKDVIVDRLGQKLWAALEKRWLKVNQSHHPS